MVGKNDINMNKIILSAILIVLSATCTQAFAQKAEDRGTFEIELATNHSQGTFSPGINGRLSVGYVVAFITDPTIKQCCKADEPMCLPWCHS